MVWQQQVSSSISDPIVADTQRLSLSLPFTQQVIELTKLQPHVARQLLQEMRWSYEKLAEQYYEVRIARLHAHTLSYTTVPVQDVLS